MDLQLSNGQLVPRAIRPTVDRVAQAVYSRAYHPELACLERKTSPDGRTLTMSGTKAGKDKIRLRKAYDDLLKRFEKLSRRHNDLLQRHTKAMITVVRLREQASKPAPSEPGSRVRSVKPLGDPP